MTNHHDRRSRPARCRRRLGGVTAVGVLSAILFACQGIADYPGYTATFTKASDQEVLVRFEGGVLKVESEWSEDSRGTTETLYSVPPGSVGVGVDWVYMDWGGGLLNPPDPVSNIRVLTLACEAIGLFEVRKGGGEPRVLIDGEGHATVSYAGGHNPEASISEAENRCPSAAASGRAFT